MCKGTNDKGPHISGANRPRGVSNKGHNIQEFPVRDSPVRDAITLHPQGLPPEESSRGPGA
jgi:hypothetical protein